MITHPKKKINEIIQRNDRSDTWIARRSRLFWNDVEVNREQGGQDAAWRIASSDTLLVTICFETKDYSQQNLAIKWTKPHGRTTSWSLDRPLVVELFETNKNNMSCSRNSLCFSLHTRAEAELLGNQSHRIGEMVPSLYMQGTSRQRNTSLQHTYIIYKWLTACVLYQTFFQ